MDEVGLKMDGSYYQHSKSLSVLSLNTRWVLLISVHILSRFSIHDSVYILYKATYIAYIELYVSCLVMFVFTT